MEAQLDAKRARIARALEGHRELTGLAVPEVAAARPDLGYRPRAKWVVGPAGELGLFAREGDHVVVDTPSCRVVEPAVARAGDLVRRALAGRHRPLLGTLRAVDVRGTVRGETLVTLGVTAAPRGRELAHALARDLTEQGVAGVAIAVAPGATERVVAGRPEPVAGATELVDEAGPVHVTAAFGAFVQSHRAQSAELSRRVTLAVTALGPSPRVLELYAGSGALGLAVAVAGARVTMVESFEPAARGIARSAAGDGISVEAHADDAERFVLRAASSGDAFDAVIVDPPRRGLPPGLRRAIAALGPRLLVYVSCEPATWARDVSHFAELGLACTRLEALDMMPHTDEVEILASLEAREPTEREPIELSPGFRVRDVHPHASTEVVTRPRGASGLFSERAPPATAEWTALVIVQGVPHARGRLTRDVTYVRTEVVGGHGVLELSGRGAPGAAVAALARIAHPVLGDPRAGRAAQAHFFEKHGLDRLALHVGAVRVGQAEARAPLAGDLVSVLASLRAAPTRSRRPAIADRARKQTSTRPRSGR